VARRDFLVGHTVQGGVITGAVRGAEGQPIVGARVSVTNLTTTTKENGVYRLAGVPVGTQWLVVRTVTRAPAEQAVDIREGETLTLDFALGAVAVTLDTVRVRANRLTATLQEIEDRRHLTEGLFRDEKDIAGRPDVAAAFQGLPSVEVARPRGGAFVVILPARNARERGCVATVYLDGLKSDYEEVSLYRTEDLRAIEVFPRASQVPIKYASTSGCGVILVWTKYLQ
jgi:hypothetical protein